MALESVNIEIALPSAASAGADWSPPRQFDFDANVQSRKPDLKVQKERSSTCSCPTPWPHGHFCGVLSALQDKQKPRICGAFDL
jgi:hypothetical protein